MIANAFVVTHVDIVACGNWGTSAYQRVKKTKSGKPDKRTKLGKLISRYEQRMCNLSLKRFDAELT